MQSRMKHISSIKLFVLNLLLYMKTTMYKKFTKIYSLKVILE